MAPLLDEAPAIAPAPEWISTPWDGAGPLFNGTAPPDFLAPGSARLGAISWDALDETRSLDFADPPDPASPAQKLTAFLAILLLLAGISRRVAAVDWNEVVSEIYYPRNY
jgi:hypothetical protein